MGVLATTAAVILGGVVIDLIIRPKLQLRATRYAVEVPVAARAPLFASSTPLSGAPALRSAVRTATKSELAKFVGVDVENSGFAQADGALVQITELWFNGQRRWDSATPVPWRDYRDMERRAISRNAPLQVDLCSVRESAPKVLNIESLKGVVNYRTWGPGIYEFVLNADSAGKYTSPASARITIEFTGAWHDGLIIRAETYTRRWRL